MFNGKRLSRGDKRRNARLARLREVLSLEHAVLALDLAVDKQVFALTDHASRVLACKTVRCRSWQLDEAIEWGRREALAAGFTGITLACESTGHRWKVVDELAATAGIALVCVQPLLVHQAREAEDFTRDKSDDKDALLIARLATQLHVYLPERADSTWAPTAPPGLAPGRVGHRCGCRTPAATRSAGVRLARGPGDGRQTAGFPELAGRDQRHRV